MSQPNGREAADLFALLPYDLVLMDCQMARNGRVRCTRGDSEARTTAPPRRDHCHDLLRPCQGSRERCLNAGMDDHIAKPVRLQDLAAIINKSLQPERAAPFREHDLGSFRDGLRNPPTTVRL